MKEYLEKGTVEKYEAAFQDLRKFAINFPSVFNNESTVDKFSCLLQLGYQILKSGIDELKVAVRNYDFLEMRRLLKYNRVHGAFLADHYGLLFEELKQRKKLSDNEWFIRIWDICCVHFSTG
jgi:hypothetical protein